MATQSVFTYRITSTLGLTKHQNLAAIHLFLKELGQSGILLAFLEEDKLLCNSVVGLQFCGTNDDPVGISEKVRSNRFHLFGPSSTPKQRLAVWPDLNKYSPGCSEASLRVEVSERDQGVR